MEHMKECLVRKFKSVVSVIYAVVLWVTRIFSSRIIQTPQALLLQSHDHHLHLGLGALVFSTLNRGTSIIYSYITLPPPPPPPLPPSPSLSSTSSFSSSSSSSSCLSSTMGDLIGTESGVYMISNEEMITTLPEVTEETKPHSPYNQRRRNHQHIGKKGTREYPPPLPLLARTGNLTGRMPWVLTRQYDDGRLILREERVENYEYFEAERENGRLLLNLIPLDDTINDCWQEESEDVEAENQSESEKDQRILVQKGSTKLAAFSSDEKAACRHGVQFGSAPLVSHDDGNGHGLECEIYG